MAAAGLSPDKRMLVVQRSPLHLQCLLLPSANMFLQASFGPVLSPHPIARRHLKTRHLVVPLVSRTCMHQSEVSSRVCSVGCRVLIRSGIPQDMRRCFGLQQHEGAHSCLLALPRCTSSAHVYANHQLGGCMSPLCSLPFSESAFLT